MERAFSKVANRKKFALYEKVMSFCLFSPSKMRSSTIGGGSTGRRSAEAGRESVGSLVTVASTLAHIWLQNHKLWHAQVAG